MEKKGLGPTELNFETDVDHRLDIKTNDKDPDFPICLILSRFALEKKD